MSDRTTTFSELVGSNLIEIGAGRPRTVNLNGHDLPILRVANVLDGRIESTPQAHTSYPDVKGEESKVSRPGDVVLTTKGTVGRVALMPPDGPAFAYSPQLCFFRPAANGPLRSRFLYYWFKSADFWTQANSLKGQTDMADFLSLGDIQRMRIGVPSLDRQDAVVSVLGALDDKIVVNENTSVAALELGGATYDAASRTSDWKDVSLGQIARWYSGGTPNTAEPTFWSGDIPWISAASLKSPWLEESDRKVTELGASNGTRLVPKGTVIFVVRGMSLKTEFRIGIARRTVAFGQDCKALIPLNGIEGDLLFHAIRNRSADVLDLVDEAGHGTGRLATDRIERMVVRVPSDRSDRINEALQNLNDLAASRQRESRTLADLRDLLLPKLMSGEIRVRGAEKVVEEAL